ncbi:MAG: hypothetical protein E7211_20675 [Clostridium lundense]|nr:hypothetical protein [Clostridium lundense]
MKLKVLKIILCLFVLCTFTMAFAAEGIYVVKGTGKYSEYMELKGLEKGDKYQVFYSGNHNSFHVIVVDNRKLDPNQKITWEYGGKTYTSTRKECNALFSDLSYLQSKYGVKDWLITDDWLLKTFGQVYFDWAEYLGYSNDASRAVCKYLDEQNGIVYIDRYTFAEQNTSEMFENNNGEEWIPLANILDTVQFGKYTLIDKNTHKAKNTYAFYVQGLTNMKLVYLVDDMTDLFIESENGAGTFNGIRIKKSKGELYFNGKDLKSKNII